MNNSKFWTGADGPAKMNNNMAVSNGTKSSGIKLKGIKSKSTLVKGIGITGVIIAVVIVAILGVGYILIGKPALALYSSTDILKADANAIVEAMKNRDILTLEQELSKTETDIEKVRKQRDESLSWAKTVTFFQADEFYSDSDRFLNAGLYAIDALREAVTISKPFADAAGFRITEEQVVNEEEGLMEAFQTWVSIMPEVSGQMDGVIAKVEKIGDELQPIDTSKYPEEFRGIEIRSNIDFLKKTLSNANSYGPDIKKALTVFPRVLAVGEPIKRYMVIMQNDKEIRPTGGFMTNYATFKIQDGLLQSDFTSKDMYSIDLTLDIIDATYDFPDAPPAYTKYLKVERWYARDMNSSPDLVTSMDQFLKFYNMAGRINPTEIKAVDGIIMIDTQVVKELLEVTGPVTVNGVTYTSDNVVLELEKIASLALREQANRKRVLGDLMQSMLINVFESDKNMWPKLIDRGVDLALRKHVQAYVFDAEAQELIEKYNFGGRLWQNVDGDYSTVISTNLGGDKTNWFTSKQVNHTLTKEGDKWIRTVKLKYTYNNPEGDYTLFANRFRDWIRVYAPLGSKVLSVEGSEDGTETAEDLGKTLMTGYIELGPGESKEITFKYELPENTIKGEVYVLNLQKQAGIESETHTITVNGKTTTLELSKDQKISVKL